MCAWFSEGDFNEITFQNDMRGKGSRSWLQIQGFRDMLDKLGLVDLGFKGKNLLV